MAMTTRERYLALAIGVIVGIFALQYGVSSVLKSFDDKQARIDAATQANAEKQKQVNAGLRAQARLRDLKPKSLPSNPQAALAQYGDWLIKSGREAGLGDLKVDPVGTMAKGRVDAYSAYQFSMTGTCRVEQLIDYLSKFYDKDCLHSLRSLKIDLSPNDPATILVKITTEAIALKIADANQDASELPSGRLSKSPAEYLSVIGGRNPFAPPNKPPTIASKNSAKAERGKEWSMQLEAKDPDPLQKVRFELLSDKIEGLKLDPSGKISWKPEANGEVELQVRAIDSGLPAKFADQTIKLSVVDPVIPPPPAPPPPKFDVASQTEVSALLSGKDGAKALIRSKLDNKTLEVRAGDDFEIGSVKAKVIALNMEEKYIELDSDGHRWTVGMDTSLADAYKKSLN